MLQQINIQLLNQISTRLPSVFLMTFVKALFMIAVIYVAVRMLRKLSSRYKHLLWFIVICVMLVLPVIQFMSQSYEVGVVRLTGFGEETRSRVAGLLFPEMGNEVRSSVVSSSAVETEPVMSVNDSGTGSTVSTSNTAAVAEKAGSAFSLNTLLTSYSWTFVVMLIWVGGMLFFLSKIVIGNIGLLLLAANADPATDKHITIMIKRLTEELDIKRKVLVLQSNRCSMPFTCRIIRSVILLPLSVRDWPEERLRAVLIHELAHIRRRDCLTQYISRVVCSMLWFIPVVWVANRNLLMEQEKACDSLVIGAGEEPAEYAGHIVDLVRYSRERILFAGVYNALGRRDVLERRVTYVLRIKREKVLNRMRDVWKVLVVCMLCVLAPVFIHPSIGPDVTYVAKEDEELYGIWLNDDYSLKNENNSFMFDRSLIEFKSDGRLILYETALDSDSIVKHFHTYNIENKWTDSNGTIWYKFYQYCSQTNTTHYTLCKISNSGKTLEYSNFSGAYPDDIYQDSYLYDYFIYFLHDKE
jgi:beta-lactamase regulating signal transducer with metallopeptidase domain